MSRARSLTVATVGDLIIERDADRPSGRLLRQDDMDASYVDLADARHLEFEYLRWIRIVLQGFGPQRVVHVGGAACTLARALLAEDAESRHEVIEIDPAVFEVAREHLGLRSQRGLKLRAGDGREALAERPDASADAVVIDAFIGARVPRHLVTRQALAECARVAPLTVINVVDTTGWPETKAISAGLAEVYPHVGALSAGTRKGGNVVLFGSSREPRLGQIENRAAADVYPARLARVRDLSGAAPWHDQPAQDGRRN